MKTTKLRLLMLITPVFMQCQSTKFTNTYKRIKEPTMAINSPIDIVKMSFISRKYKPIQEKKTKKGIFDLSELGQYKLIAQYGENDKTSKALRDNLIEPLEKSKPKVKKVIDDGNLSFPTRFTFFISDELGKDNPANRIVSLKIRVKLKSTDIQFQQFNGFQTKYEYYDIGAIENTTTRNFSLDATVGAGTTNSQSEFDENGNQLGNRTSNFGPSVAGTLGGTNTVKENVLLKRRVISQAGSLSSDVMTIYLEGTPQRNLNGPITVELTLISDPSYSNLIEVPYVNFSSIVKPVPKVVITPRFLYKPITTNDILGDVEMEWVYRHVAKNGNTPFEGDDVIEYYEEDGHTYFTNTNIIEIKDLKRTTFELELTCTTCQASIPLFFQKNTGRKHPIRFLNQEETIKFLNHISDNSLITVGGYKIVKSNGTPIVKADISNIGIQKNIF